MSSNNDTKQFQDKLKKIIASLFQQLTNGCPRKYCFNNIYCKNSINFTNPNISSLDKKDLITYCIKKVQSVDNMDALVCTDFTKYTYQSKYVEKFDDWISLYSIIYTYNESGYSEIYCNPKKCKELFVESFDVFKEISSFNNIINNIFKDYFNKMLIDYSSNENALIEETEERQQLIIYLLKLYFNFINFLLINSLLFYNSNESKNTTILFENFSIILQYYQRIKNSNFENFTKNLFIEYTRDKNYLVHNNAISYKNAGPENLNSINIFTDVIHNIQSFLTMIVIDLTEPEKSEQTQEDLKVLVGLLRLFEQFYKCNKEFKLIPNTLFENEKVNTYLSLKVECQSYFKHHHQKNYNMNNYNIEIDYFSFVKYNFLYDSARKKDIISYYNLTLQSINSMSSIDEILNGQGIGMHLVIVVKRNDLIKTTLDKVSNNLNFKKQLKVTFFSFR